MDGGLVVIGPIGGAVLSGAALEEVKKKQAQMAQRNADRCTSYRDEVAKRDAERAADL